MFSSFKQLLCVAAFACAVAAQNINIASPSAGTTVKGGSTLSVRLDKPASSGSKEVSVAIGVSPCPGGSCQDISQSFGTILYSGPFDPETPDGSGGVYQDIPIPVPNSFNGPAKLNVARFHFSESNSGAAAAPELQLASTTITVSDNSG